MLLKMYLKTINFIIIMTYIIKFNYFNIILSIKICINFINSIQKFYQILNR